MLAPAAVRSSARPLLFALFALNGVTVSTLYWAQAMAGLARLETGPSVWASLMQSATLAGYAVGVSLLAIVARDLTTANGLGLHALLLGVGLGAAAVAPTAPLIVLACFLAGAGCSLTQRVLACASSAVAPRARGPVIGGIVASGLAGIVVARAVIPVASAALGWRTMFILDAGLVCVFGLAGAIAAQRVSRAQWEAEPTGLPSARALWMGAPVLRRAALQQAAVFAVFNLGWAVFPHMLHQADLPTSLLMGVVASLGAVAAGIAGWVCSRSRPCVVATAGLGAAVAGGATLVAGSPGIASCLSMVLLDVGTQTALVANQAQAQALATSPAMRGRLAAIVTSVSFTAGAIGAALGNLLP